MQEDEQFSPFAELGNEHLAERSKTDDKFIRFPSLDHTPTITTGLKVRNMTTERIVFYDALGLPLVLRNDLHRTDGVSEVEVEFTITTTCGTTVLSSEIDKLTTRLSPEIVARIQQQVRNNEAFRSTETKTIILRWAIPLEVIQASDAGIRLGAVGIVIRHVPHDGTLWRPTDWPKAESEKKAKSQPMEGMHAYLNTPDDRVKGVWINIGKGQPIKLCSSHNDVNAPYGFVLWVNGIEEIIPLEQLFARGYYTTKGQASLASARNAAEEKELQKEKDMLTKAAALGLAGTQLGGDAYLKAEKAEQEKIKTKDAARKSVKDMAMAFIEFVRGTINVVILMKSVNGKA